MGHVKNTLLEAAQTLAEAGNDLATVSTASEVEAIIRQVEDALDMLRSLIGVADGEDGPDGVGHA